MCYNCNSKLQNGLCYECGLVEWDIGNIINLTPHPINLVLGDTEIIIKPSGSVARCSEEPELKGVFQYKSNRIPVYYNRLGNVEGVPPFQEYIIYIVSRMVAEALVGREYIYYPYGLIRDDEGNVIGCRGLADF